MKKLLLIAFVLLIVAVLVVATRSGKQQPPKTMATAQVNDRSTTHAHDGYGMGDYAATGRVPAYYSTAPDIKSLPPTLSPGSFTGNIKLAYQAAKEIPQVLAQLPCYCHCDRGHGHKSLHSCFESEHGENCGICIGEAIMAHTMQKRGVSAADIRKQVIATYGTAEKNR
jgi:uncharacterized protein with PCYCGC motif